MKSIKRCWNVLQGSGVDLGSGSRGCRDGGKGRARLASERASEGEWTRAGARKWVRAAQTAMDAALGPPAEFCLASYLCLSLLPILLLHCWSWAIVLLISLFLWTFPSLSHNIPHVLFLSSPSLCFVFHSAPPPLFLFCSPCFLETMKTTLDGHAQCHLDPLPS